jgi:hypothetical protein
VRFLPVVLNPELLYCQRLAQLVRIHWHHSWLSIAIKQNVWRRRISAIHPISQHIHNYPSRLAAAQYHHIVTLHVTSYRLSARHHSIQATNHDSQTAAGPWKRVSIVLPSFLGPPNSHQPETGRRAATSLLVPEAEHSSTTVVVSSSGHPQSTPLTSLILRIA